MKRNKKELQRRRAAEAKPGEKRKDRTTTNKQTNKEGDRKSVRLDSRNRNKNQQQIDPTTLRQIHKGRFPPRMSFNLLLWGKEARGHPFDYARGFPMRVRVLVVCSILMVVVVVTET
jgi:hypothetical protein